MTVVLGLVPQNEAEVNGLGKTASVRTAPAEQPVPTTRKGLGEVSFLVEASDEGGEGRMKDEGVGIAGVTSFKSASSSEVFKARPIFCRTSLPCAMTSTLFEERFSAVQTKQ